MTYLLALVTSTAVSIAIIPVMVRLAPWLGMIDHPDPRKVHVKPVPRVGGWGIVIGALVPLLIWMPMGNLLLCYIFGALVLLAFGAWDDRREMGHYKKFGGQFLAVLPVVTYGDLYVYSLPFLGWETISSTIGIPFTVMAMIGMINAMNHSDGLDGLAGGESLLSLGAIAFLAYLAGSDVALTIAVVALGGLLGFLRYNTHPATVFMGDGGSQFLGFTLGFLAVLLTQKTDPTLSPTVVLLLLGFPIADILFVLAKRITQGMNWFRATKNHVHHRLLQLGFVHQESVVNIYSVQAFLVLSGIMLRHQSDWLILYLYLSSCVVIFAGLYVAENAGWTAHEEGGHRPADRSSFNARYRKSLLVVAPRRFLDSTIPLYFIVGSVLVEEVPHDFGLAGLLLFFLILIQVFLGKTIRSIARRGLVYITAAFIVYLFSNYPPEHAEGLESLEISFFVLLAVATAVAIIFSPRRRKFEFRITTMDYLMVVVVFATLILGQIHSEGSNDSLFVIKLAIVFYSCELLIIEQRDRWNRLTVSSLATTALLTMRGLM